MAKVSLLTNAQALTVMRMGSGTRYIMRGNMQLGMEEKIWAENGESYYVKCKSLAPLMRKGMIKFSNDSERRGWSYYELELTPEGQAMYQRIKENNDE